MTTETDHLPASLVDRGPLQQMIAVQLAWQQLFWRLALSPWSNARQPSPHVPPVASHSPAPSGHEQLIVPSAIAADGEHALFA